MLHTMKPRDRLLVYFDRMNTEAKEHILELAEKYAERWPDALVAPVLHLVAVNPGK